MDLNIILILCTCGIISNILSAILGIGGGVLLVPLLMTVFNNIPIQMVAATSLSIVIGSAIINLSYFIKKHITISYKNLAIWTIGMSIGIKTSLEINFILGENIIVIIFISTMFILALKTLYSCIKTKNNNTDITDIKDYDKLNYTGLIFCLIGGLVAGITGIGGGSIMAPLIGQLKNVKHQQIAVYTNYMMVLGGLSSMYGYLTKDIVNPFANTIQIGYINLNIIGIVILSSFLTSFISMKLIGLIKPKLCNILLFCVLAFIAIYTYMLKYA